MMKSYHFSCPKCNNHSLLNCTEFAGRAERFYNKTKKVRVQHGNKKPFYQ
jgi:hypothetical protein